MEQTERLICFFEEHRDALMQISVEELRDVAQLASIVIADDVYSEKLKGKAYDVLCHAITEENLPLEERWAIYWTLTFKIFTSTEYDEYREALDKAYAGIYLDIEKRMPEELLRGNAKSGADGPVVIVTNQFIAPEHAPTRRVLDYAYALKKFLGIPVKIINDAGTNFNHVPYIMNAYIFNFVEELSKIRKISYKDMDFDFFQINCPMPNLQEMANVIYNIKQMTPRLVLSVGGSCLTSDLCRGFAKTAAINCSTSMPCTMGECLVLCRELRDTDSDRIRHLYPWQYVVESSFNYIMPDDSNFRKYTREMFGIPEDAWLLISAGSRMELELDQNFMQMIDHVLEELPACHFMVIGGMNDESIRHITDGLLHMDKIHFSGSLQDGSQAIRLGDVYIQPTRKGGGRAAFEALYYSVPVITTKYGDTWDVCGSSFEVTSYEEMAERIKKYYQDKNFYAAYREKAKEQAHLLEDMVGMFQNLLPKLGVDWGEKAWDIEMSKFYDIFAQPKENEVAQPKGNEDSFNELKRMIHGLQWRMRENEWANVFRDTVIGSEWLKNVSLSPGRNAIGYPGLYALYRSLDEFRPKNILEIGLGQSTKVIGAYAEYYGVRHSIVEHDASWIHFFLNRHGKNKSTNIVYLERLEDVYHGRWVDTETPIMHYQEFAASFVGEKFDFIFIDGPQGSEEYSRVDITELLPECLADSFVIMLDDSERLGEKRTLCKIFEILDASGISFGAVDYDGMKNTALIASKNLSFLLSL